MPIPRDTTKPQFNLGQGAYGELPVEGLPSGDADGDFWYWDQLLQQWTFIKLEAGAGLVLDFDRDLGKLRLTLASAINQYSFTASAVLLRTISASFSANATLFKTQSGTFTADSVLIV